MSITYHNSPTECQLCHANITDEFSDVALPHRRHVWANVCPECAESEDVLYGTGKGQLYRLHDDGLFHKVGG